jgi:hypothetical protein
MLPKQQRESRLRLMQLAGKVPLCCRRTWAPSQEDPTKCLNRSAWPVGPSWLHGFAFQLYLGLRGYIASSRRWPLRADRVEVTWDKSRSTWLIRITSGEEVIRRSCKLPKDSNEQALRSAAQKTLQDEGYEPDPISIALEGYGASPLKG